MKRDRSPLHAATSQPRPRRRIHEEPHDVYGLRGKLPEPTRCPTCSAVYRQGRWTWAPAPFAAHETVCPACRRIRDEYPAGLVTLEGDFVASHRGEIENLVRNLEQREQSEHALKRIFAILEREGDSLCIPTTDARLARGIGRALHSAYQGELDEPEPQVEGLVRVHWRRDDASARPR
jgi:hypothetical protein